MSEACVLGKDISTMIDHGDGRYSSPPYDWSSRGQYCPLELYLAGFIGPEDVPDFRVAVDAEWPKDELGGVTLDNNGYQVFTASGFETYTIDDIIAEHGPRVPDSSQAQKDFRAAVVLLVSTDYPATPLTLDTLSYDVSWFSHPGERDHKSNQEKYQYANFYQYTGGRGTITMDGLSDFLTATPTLAPTATTTATPTPVPTATPTAISKPVTIPDPNLRREIERSLGKSSGTPVFSNEMETLLSFEVRYEQIGDLEGIQFATTLRRLELVEIRGSLVQGPQEHSPLDLSPLAALTNLTRLNLSQNKISDLLPLAGLTNLEYLSLEAVYIRRDESDTSTLDLSPLAGLTKLTDLALSYNNILDISPLASLTALERLNISKNHISDISPLVSLTKLVNLNGQENRIADVSPLSGLAALQEVVLPVNEISDTSPLVANVGLGSGDVVDVRTNPLNAESIDTHIPALQARGVSVSFDEVIAFTDPQIYNGNVFVLPVSENLAAGDLRLKDYGACPINQVRFRLSLMRAI